MSDIENTEKSTKRPTLDEQIEKMEKRLEQAKAKKERLDAKKSAILTARQEKADGRRKILLGDCMLDFMKKNPENKKIIDQFLDNFLTKKADRDLFNLPKKEKTHSSPKE